MKKESIILNMLRIIIKIIPYLFIQIIFIIMSPIFLIITLFSVPDILGFGVTIPAPKSFKEWMKEWVTIIFNPINLFFK